MLRTVAFMAAVGLLLSVAGSLSAGARKPDKKKLLVVTYTQNHGTDNPNKTFRHSSIPTAEKVLAEIGERSGVYEVAYCRTATDVKQMLTPEGLKGIDGVFFANTTGNLGIPDLNAFLDWIKAGHGFMGAHSAADTYHASQADGNTGFVDMIGGEFKTHGAQCEIQPIVNDRKHPAVNHFGTSAKFFDEIYIYVKNNRPNVHVLLAVDKHPNDRAPDANQPGDHLIAWNREYGKGKVFYTALGHREDVWAREDYQQHLLGGIRWALGLAKGDAKPGNPAVGL